jgi:hypothetical protein
MAFELSQTDNLQGSLSPANLRPERTRRAKSDKAREMVVVASLLIFLILLACACWSRFRGQYEKMQPGTER